MRFFDKVKVDVKSGKGGDWCVSWRREKYVALWGPDGWDGGKWASVFFIGDKNLNSLHNLHHRKSIKWKNGENGKWKDLYGKSAEDVYIPVAIGTSIKNVETDEIIDLITEDGQEVQVVNGGSWGWGNIHFSTPTKQFANFAMFGEPGEKKAIELELQLIGDVTLIGFPSVGKSSIINTISNVKAQVADYAFTTLVPNLGVIKHRNKDFVMVDMPWLIEEASKGKWLWNEFLRHILKSNIWTFILDISRYEQSFEELETLKKEIESYILIRWKEKWWSITYEIKEDSMKLLFYVGEKLAFTKTIIFLINKIDLVNDEEIIEEYKKELIKKIKKIFSVKKTIKNIFIAHAGNKNSFESFLDYVIKVEEFQENIEYIETISNLWEHKKNYIKNVTETEVPKLLENEYITEEKADYVQVFEVYDREIAYYSYILPWGNEEAEHFFWELMEKMWKMSLMERQWIHIKDIIKVMSPYSGVLDRYVEIDY